MSSPKDRSSLFPHHGLPFEETPLPLTAEKTEMSMGTWLQGCEPLLSMPQYHPPSFAKPGPVLPSDELCCTTLVVTPSPCPKAKSSHSCTLRISSSHAAVASSKSQQDPSFLLWLWSPTAKEPKTLLGEVLQLLGFPQICRILANAPGSPAVPQEVIEENLNK